MLAKDAWLRRTASCSAPGTACTVCDGAAGLTRGAPRGSPGAWAGAAVDARAGGRAAGSARGAPSTPRAAAPRAGAHPGRTGRAVGLSRRCPARGAVPPGRAAACCEPCRPRGRRRGGLHRARGRTLDAFSSEKEKDWQGPFYFIQGADPQFGLMKAWSTGDCEHGGDEWAEEIRLTEQAVHIVNALRPRPRFFVLCGDLVHAMPGMPWRQEQTEDLQRVLGKVDSSIPLVLVSGNHDLGNSPTAQTVAEFCQTWGDDYFSFWAGGILFLVLNSQLWHDASQCPELRQAQDHWLDQQLAAARTQGCRQVVVFQHIPLFLQNIGEDDDYFNLGTTIRQELADKLTRAGVKAVFAGHYHRNAGGTYESLDMVVSSAIGCQLGTDTHGLRVVVVTAQGIVHRYYSLDELSEKGLDGDLLDLLRGE
ncbi:serine/threonine-protein phosphatase CPPED1 [Sorex fumeus]|uniref:serine/threonine-protein phosphatase CPPED1 n=1 Tax=Sorex fumeus TaxID=62283 RepID=UPI0024AE5B05|nr:serine/threonine-protein phosphatase CPPED1 [Sorex fumeus]